MVGLGYLAAIINGLHLFIPGLIHALKVDGGAESIAGFTNFSRCKAEILFFFRVIGELAGEPASPGVWGAVQGTTELLLILLSCGEDIGGFHLKVASLPPPPYLSPRCCGSS